MDQEKELGEARTAINSLKCENNRLSQHHQKIQVGGATVRRGLTVTGFGFDGARRT